MNHRFFKIVTPLRILFIIFLILSFFQFDEFKKVAFLGEKNGFSGIGFVILGITSVLTIIIDFILSYFFKPKKNWMLQSLVILLFVCSIIIF